MADEHKQAEEMRDDVPSTIARSDDKAVRTYKKTLESAEETYGDGERAHRTAFAALKCIRFRAIRTAVSGTAGTPPVSRATASIPSAPHHASAQGTRIRGAG